MDEKQFNILLDRIDKLSRVIVIQTVRDIGREQDKVELLDSVGFKPSEIGRLLGKSTANVSVVLGTLRKKRDTVSQSDADSAGPKIQTSPPNEAKDASKGKELVA